MSTFRAWVAVCVLVGLLAGAVNALNMETVPVGDAGNAADMRYAAPGAPYYGNGIGYGSVNYEYRIGKYEVTAGQYTEFLNAVAKTDTYGLYNVSMWTSTYGCKIERSGSSGSYSYGVAADWAGRPVNYLSWGDAARYANWMHNGQPTGLQGPGTTEDGSYDLNGANSNVTLSAVTRRPNATWVIPTEDEWYKAAYYDPGRPGGAGYWDYPTRDDAYPNNVLDPAGTNNANYYGSYGHGNLGYCIGDPYYRTEVGAFENSPSPYGTFDQGGNVYERNETLISDQYGSYRVARGGYFGNSDSNMLASNVGIWGDPIDEFNYIGFRLAYIPEPATLLLLALGGLALMRRRVRRIAGCDCGVNSFDSGVNS